MVKLYNPLSSSDVKMLESIVYNFSRQDVTIREVLLYCETAERIKPFFSDYKLEHISEKNCGLPGSKLYTLRKVGEING